MKSMEKTKVRVRTIPTKKESYLKDVLYRFSKHKLAMIGLVTIVLEILIVLLLPVILDADPYSLDLVSGFAAAPSSAHVLGTDEVGRDMLARLLYGGRTSLRVGLLSAMISLFIGVPIGLLAGYYKGILSGLMMRLSDVFMSVPAMILILVLVSVIGPSVRSVIIVIGVMGWPQFARQLYGSVLAVKEREYVEGARAVGVKNKDIMLKYVLPNAFAPVIISFTFAIASAILIESALSFLGMGVQPPMASWGNIMYAAQSIVIISQKPWMWVPPGIALLITVISINFFGDGLRDALDPKTNV